MSQIQISAFENINRDIDEIEGNLKEVLKQKFFKFNFNGMGYKTNLEYRCFHANQLFSNFLDRLRRLDIVVCDIKTDTFYNLNEKIKLEYKIEYIEIQLRNHIYKNEQVHRKSRYIAAAYFYLE